MRVNKLFRVVETKIPWQRMIMIGKIDRMLYSYVIIHYVGRETTLDNTGKF